jgi:hypothetical protein
VNRSSRVITLHEADGVFEALNDAFEVVIVHSRRAFFNGSVKSRPQKKARR